MTKSIGEGNGSLNKPEFDDVPDAFFNEVFNYESQLTQGYVEQVPNIGTIGTVEVPVELAGNVINEEGNEEENGEEESTESDTDIDGRRRRLEFEDSADESDKEIYETDNDAALDDNNEFDVNLQSNFGRVGNTYLPKDFVAAAFEEDSDTNSEKGLDSPYYSSNEEGERRRKFPEFGMSDLDNPKFEKGMLFGSKEVLKKAVKNYAVQGNYHINHARNDKV
ncbi:hypothetical protein CerSpe_205780 [Prunus speciosa]